MITADEIRKHTEEFLARGKKITEIPFGVSGESGISVKCFCGCKGVTQEHMDRAKTRARTANKTRRQSRKANCEDDY